MATFEDGGAFHNEELRREVFDLLGVLRSLGLKDENGLERRWEPKTDDYQAFVLTFAFNEKAANEIGITLDNLGLVKSKDVQVTKAPTSEEWGVAVLRSTVDEKAFQYWVKLAGIRNE